MANRDTHIQKTNRDEIFQAQVTAAIARGRHMRSLTFRKSFAGLRDLVLKAFKGRGRAPLIGVVREC